MTTETDSRVKGFRITENRHRELIKITAENLTLLVDALKAYGQCVASAEVSDPVIFTESHYSGNQNKHDVGCSLRFDVKGLSSSGKEISATFYVDGKVVLNNDGDLAIQYALGPGLKDPMIFSDFSKLRTAVGLILSNINYFTKSVVKKDLTT